MTFKGHAVVEHVRPGRILGVKEAFSQIGWETSLFSKTRGTLAFIRLVDLDYLATQNANVYGLFLEFLVTSEAKRLRELKKGLQYMAGGPAPRHDSFGLGDPQSERVIEEKHFEDFLEVDVREKCIKSAELKSKPVSAIKQFKMDLAIPPLFVHKCFRALLDNESFVSNILQEDKVTLLG